MDGKDYSKYSYNVTVFEKTNSSADHTARMQPGLYLKNSILIKTHVQLLAASRSIKVTHTRHEFHRFYNRFELAVLNLLNLRSISVRTCYNQFVKDSIN